MVKTYSNPVSRDAIPLARNHAAEKVFYFPRWANCVRCGKYQPVESGCFEQIGDGCLYAHDPMCAECCADLRRDSPR